MQNMKKPGASKPMDKMYRPDRDGPKGPLPGGQLGRPMPPRFPSGVSMPPAKPGRPVPSSGVGFSGGTGAATPGGFNPVGLRDQMSADSGSSAKLMALKRAMGQGSKPTAIQPKR